MRSSSQFRRSGQRDDRRRRLLAEEPSGVFGAGLRRGASRSGGDSLPQRKSENYGDADFMDAQSRLIDLVPRRLTTFGVLFLAGLSIVAGLEVLYSWASSPAISGITTDGRIASLDLDGEGSLAVWFSSAVLSLAALVAIIVYTVRRHKTDDYRGYYRIWLWAAICWFMMSVDETASLHEAFKGMMVYVTGTPVLGDGSIWWVVPYFLLLGAVGSRLLVDMRHCRLASGALLAAAGCYALAVVAQLGWILPESGARGVMLEEGAEMVGNLFVLFSMGLYARYVILDAEGLLPPRKSKSRGRGGEESEEEEYDEEASATLEEWIKVDSPHDTPQPVLKRTAATAKKRRRSEASPVKRKLTKAEKKTLRKRLLQERLEHERKQRSGWKE